MLTGAEGGARSPGRRWKGVETGGAGRYGGWVRLLAALVLVPAGCGPKGERLPGLGIEQIFIGSVPIQVEVAWKPEQWQLGLMERDTIPAGWGMFFAFPEKEHRTFHMRNCRFPIDIAFIDDDGVIREIHAMVPDPSRKWHSQGMYRYALEVKAGWFEGNGIGIGDRVRDLAPIRWYQGKR